MASQSPTPSHDHLHDAGHAHSPASFGNAFAIGISLNLGFVIVEATLGFLSNSTALIADAGHNLSDVMGLVVAWAAAGLAKRAPSARYTYGLRSASILAALFNAMFLLVAVGAIAWEAIARFQHPEPVAGITVMIVAGIGIAINGFTAMLFASGRKSDINIRGAFLHMAADAAVSLGVVIAGGLILVTGREWIDPVTSLLICAAIVWSTWSLLGDSVRMSLAAVPPGIRPADVRAFLEKLPGVASMHDLHIWPVSTTETALTCHLVMPEGHPGDAFLMEVSHTLEDRFGIAHVTIQIETAIGTACRLAPEDVV